MKQDSIDRHVARWRGELDYVDPVHEAIVGRLMILGRHLSGTRAVAHADTGLDRPSFKVLLALRRVGPPYVASPSELAAYLGLSRGALSARLGPLEDDRLITRALDRDDRRRVHVRLTPKGRRAFDRHARLEGRAEADLLDVLSPADQRRLADLLHELVLAVETS
ncbi:MarR family winged helix-turn-helix transcriptional regulator [Nocardioides halotolerans]|uniref:MarR family winged helix-turn-helix transcriptional regulator n=1 Tax=Nocardioides halotolerans TaxID=433660 RepID=UPI000421EB81|nr:MarR family transcriptional regulator [Nocardioides halotolerans]